MVQPPYFALDSDWAAFAATKGIPVGTNDAPSSRTFEAVDVDVGQARHYQDKSDEEWMTQNSLDSIDYEAHLTTIIVRDGAKISVRVTYPKGTLNHISGALSLPVLFVAHGGGYVSGSHASEERWLLRPLQSVFDLVTISVEYRLAPEHKFPTWIEDVWDGLEHLLLRKESLLPEPISSMVTLENLILAGSSAGGGICAVLSQLCRDRGVNVSAVILNVPMLCEYRHFPTPDGTSVSFLECNQGILGSAHLAATWRAILPSDEAASDPRASPLLGRLDRLPQHIIFVAGRDPLRDDGLEYAKRLREVGVSVRLHAYSGVPHFFALFKELQATKRFHVDLVEEVRQVILQSRKDDGVGP